VWSLDAGGADYFFDLARWYLSAAGVAVSVYARANATQADRPELHSNFSAIVNFPGGAYALVSQTLAAYEHHQVVKLTGTAGALWTRWSGAMDRTFQPTFSLQHFDGKDTVTAVPLDQPSGDVFELAEEMAMMVRAVRDDGPVAASGADGRWSVALCLAAQQSAATGAVVAMDEFLHGQAPGRPVH